jgi:hypothetical protein
MGEGADRRELVLSEDDVIIRVDPATSNIGKEYQLPALIKPQLKTTLKLKVKKLQKFVFKRLAAQMTANNPEIPVPPATRIAISCGASGVLSLDTTISEVLAEWADRETVSKAHVRFDYWLHP